MRIGEHVRQGDTLLRKVADIPAVAEELPRDEHGAIVLAYGERTGHMHRFTEKQICSFTTLSANDVEFLLVGGGGATLRHEHVTGVPAEHDPIFLPEGKFEAAQQVEYQPAALVRVSD